MDTLGYIIWLVTAGELHLVVCNWENLLFLTGDGE